MTEFMNKKKETFSLMLLSLCSGILFNYFFYEKTLGVAYPLYVLLLLGLFWYSAREEIRVEKSFGWLLLIPIFLLAVTFALYSNPVLKAINFLLVPLLVVVHSLAITQKIPEWASLETVKAILRQTVPNTIINIPVPFVLIAREARPESSSVQQIGKKVAIGLLVSIPMLFVLIPLLSSADLVFDYYVSNLTNLDDLIQHKSWGQQLLLLVLVFSYVFAYIYGLQHCSATKKDSTAPQIRWDGTILLTVLSVLSCVYLLFTVIQFSYLYGSGSQELPQAFTYADYARRGFFELVTVTVINLSILLSCLKFGQQENQTVNFVLRILLSLLVIFSLNMLFSAHFKMSLYEEAYGLTYLRVFVHYFLGLLLVLFLLAISGTWLPKLPLVKAIVVVTLVFYTALNFINVDQVIARHNLQVYQSKGKLDLYYLHSLSTDAVPELLNLLKVPDPVLVEQTRDYLVMTKEALAQETPWQSFNYSRYRAKGLLQEVHR